MLTMKRMDQKHSVAFWVTQAAEHVLIYGQKPFFY